MTATIALNPAEVHVWRVPLHLSTEAVTARFDILSNEERERADVQASDRLRRRFVVAHAETRRILAGYLGADPHALVFAVHPGGKPYLCEPCPVPRFNLSHSGELAVLAVSPDREVGIDVEWVDPRRAALFAAWTRKEAYLKATGRGIGWGLAAGERTEKPAGWTLVDIDCGDDYRATLAAEGSGWGVRVFDAAAVNGAIQPLC